MQVLWSLANLFGCSPPEGVAPRTLESVPVEQPESVHRPKSAETTLAAERSQLLPQSTRPQSEAHQSLQVELGAKKDTGDSGNFVSTASG